METQEYAYKHFFELTRPLRRKILEEQVDELRILLLAALKSSYASAADSYGLRSELRELYRARERDRTTIEELSRDRQLLLTVIEEAACMPPLFTYSRLPPYARKA